MPKKTAALRSPAAQNLLAAAVTGVTVLARPTRVPTWFRRGLTVANTAGTAGSLFMSKDDGSTGGALGVKPVSGVRNTAASASSAFAAATGGIGLLTSGIGLKLDAKAENYLIRRGFKHPRWWMAIGAVGLVFVVKTVQDAATKKGEGAAAELARKTQQQKDEQPKAKPAVTRSTVQQKSGAKTHEPAAADTSASSTVSPSTEPGTPSAPVATPATDDKPADDFNAEQIKSGADDLAAQTDSGSSSAETSASAGSSQDGSSSTPTYDAVRAEMSEGGSTVARRSPGSGVTADPATPADAPDAAPAGHADTEWTDVTDDQPQDAGSAAAQRDSDTGATNGAGRDASRFEQQLAESTPDDIDEPTPDDDHA